MVNEVPFNFGPYAQQLLLALSVVGAVVVAILRLNKHASRNAKEIGEDRASSNILSVALRQRDEALEAASKAWGQRTLDVATIARYQALEEAWNDDRKRMTREFTQMESRARRAVIEIRRLAPERAQLMFPDDWMEYDSNAKLNE